MFFPLPKFIFETALGKTQTDQRLLAEAFSVYYKKKFKAELPSRDIFISKIKNRLLKKISPSNIIDDQIFNDFKLNDFTIESFFNSTTFNATSAQDYKYFKISNPGQWGNLYDKTELNNILTTLFSKNLIPISEETEHFTTFEGEFFTPLAINNNDVILNIEINELDVAFTYFPASLQKKISFSPHTEVLEPHLISAIFKLFVEKETDYHFDRCRDILRMHQNYLQNKILSLNNSHVRINFPSATHRLAIICDNPKNPTLSPNQIISVKTFDKNQLIGIEFKIPNWQEQLNRIQSGWNNPERFVSVLNPTFTEDCDWLINNFLN